MNYSFAEYILGLWKVKVQRMFTGPLRRHPDSNVKWLNPWQTTLSTAEETYGTIFGNKDGFRLLKDE